MTMILDKFPTDEDFYKTYWNRKPFLVRGGVPATAFDDYIDADSLAGLALEDDIKSRIVITAPEGGKWACEHGPFEEDRFSVLGDARWSLLVQNVEQYHEETAGLLKAFHFSPRWLMDDIMVSYSTAGGSVGPHTDSYHVFLVQGMGKRKWRVSHSPIENAEYIDGQDLKVLKDRFDGEEVEVSAGDVIYIPPNFAHEGITLEEAMTFSVGFLGPKISEMLIEYGHYLEQNSNGNGRYRGSNLNIRNSSFFIDFATVGAVKDNLIGAINADDFSSWMVEYFSTPTYDDIENIEPREDQLTPGELIDHLKNGGRLYRAEHVKLAITTGANGALKFAVYGAIIPTLPAHKKLIHWLNDYDKITLNDLNDLGGVDALIEFVAQLYNQNVLFIA